MNRRNPDTAQDMSNETIDSLQELVQALHDSSNYLNEAADQIGGDQYVTNTLRAIAKERQQIRDNIGGFIELAQKKPDEEGTFLGNLRTIWTSFRSGLNAGDPTVILIEAERAENAIVNKFKDVLPEIAGNPVNDRLNEYFRVIKSGHDRVKSLRDAYQAA